MINVIYSGNDKYFSQIYLSCLSMAMHTKKSLCVYIMTLKCVTKKREYNPINDKQIKLLDETLKRYNVESKAILINMQELYEKYLVGKNTNLNTVYTPYSMLRLLCHHIDYLPKKIIYLDTDTMVYNDIDTLYSIDIKDYEYAASKDKVGHHFYGSDYCNSGVLLLNLEKIAKTKLFDKSIAYVLKKKSFMPDQDALNYLATSKLVLDYKFNEQRKMKEDTVIKHFCKNPKFFPIIHMVNIKQTDILNVHKKLKIFEFDDIYEIYLKEKELHQDLLF